MIVLYSIFNVKYLGILIDNKLNFVSQNLWEVAQFYAN